jgi:phenylalanyl-tRNA synthetase beta chain
MKFTLSWLKDHLDTAATVAEIAETLTRIGLEVEGIEDRAADLAPFTVVRVIEAKPHPNADRLRVCRVETAAGEVQVVCGAPNARSGMRAVFAPAGTTIPGTGLVLKRSKIRDVESNGMLVSEREMGLSNAHEGIIEMPGDAPVGTPFAPLLGLDDPVFDVAVTPNRPDCLGIYGIARDLAAAGVGTLRDGAVAPVAGAFASPTKVTLDFAAPDRHFCPAFALRLVRGVRNGASPEWLQRRLRAIGLRPINALVDITNFLTYDRGRPLHVFDAAKVKGDLVVRLARDGEEVLALDGRTYPLDAAMVVIADENGVESIAGVMGGEHSGCTEETTDVLIESALWDPLNIAQTGRRLGLNSDARYRFERGLDPAFTLPGLELATRLVLEFCGGSPAEIVLAGAIPGAREAIRFPLGEVRRLSGLDLPPAEIRAVLGRLGFAASGEGATVEVVPPSWRPDIEGKADLVEEVVRIVGLDRVPPAPLPRADGVTRPVLTPIQRRTRTARRALAARGLVEAVTWSFVSQAQAMAFGGGEPSLALANPIAVELSDMRPSLLPGLVAAAQKNADRGLPDTALFEVGQVFRADGPDGQKMAATALRRATAKPRGAGRHWSAPAAPVDAFDAKADAMALLAALGVPVERVQVVPAAPGWFHPGRSGTLQLGPQTVLGHFGELHPRVLRALDAAGPLAACEIVLDALPEPKAKASRAKPPLERTDLQPVSRDFAFVVDRAVPAADILRAVQGADRKLIVSTDIFDVYEGTGIPAGRKSVAVAVTLQPRERTLTDVEIDAVAAKVVAAVAKATGAVLRT